MNKLFAIIFAFILSANTDRTYFMKIKSENLNSLKYNQNKVIEASVNISSRNFVRDLDSILKSKSNIQENKECKESTYTQNTENEHEDYIAENKEIEYKDYDMNCEVNSTQTEIYLDYGEGEIQQDTDIRIQEDYEEIADLIVQQEESKKQEYFIPWIPMSEDLQKFTYDMCCINNVSYTLVLSMMYHESKFDTEAISYNSNGSCDSGIMQINSCNLKLLNEEYGITNLQDPYENITAGVSIISDYVNKFGENDGLMAYNMGIGGYLNAIENGIYSTQYSENILDTKAEFESMLSI